MAKAYRYTGIIHAIYPTQEFGSGFKKRLVVLKENNPEAKFQSFAAFEFIFGSQSHNDHTRIPDAFSVGEAVEVEFYTQARKNKNRQGQWFVANRAVGMERIDGATPVRIPLHENTPDEQTGAGDGDDAMPF